MTNKRIPDISALQREIIVSGVDVVEYDPQELGSSVGRFTLPTLGQCAWVNEDFAPQVATAIDHETAHDKVIEVRRSAHQVGFGRFVRRDDEKVNGRRHVLSTAVKPFGDRKSAINEILGAARLDAIGVETYTPVGLFNTSAGNVALVTKKSDTLMGLDRDTWVVSRRVENEEDAENAERNSQSVKNISKQFAWLHANGIFHPDGQLKNWGETPGGVIGAFDMERHKSLHIGDMDATSLAWYDIDKFVCSLVVPTKDTTIYGVGMLHNLGQAAQARSVRELVIDPYIESLYDIGIHHPDLTDQANMLINAVEQLSKNAMDQENWPNVYDAQKGA